MNAYLVLALLAVAVSLLMAWLMTWLIRLFFLRGRRRGVLLAFGATLLLFCVKPALDRLVFWSELDAFAADEIQPESLVLPRGDLLRIDRGYGGGACGVDCPLDELPFAARIEAPHIYDLALDPANPAIFDLWQFLDAPDRTQPFAFRYAFISLPARMYANAVGISKTRQEAWPDRPQDVHMLVEVPQSGVLDLNRVETHFRRYTAQRDLGAFLIFGGLLEEPVVMPDVQGMVRDLAQVSRAE